MSQLFNTNNPGIGDVGGVTLSEGLLLSNLDSLSYTEGDLLYVNSSGLFTNLGIGTSGQVLTTNGVVPSWGAGGGGGYTNLTEFISQTAWRVFYSDSLGDVQELALGADGTFLKSNGATAAPTFSTPTGSGDVVGPASAVDSNFAAFDTTTGKLIKDSGSKTSDFATAAQGATADTALQNVVEDTTPQLGGALDINAKDITDGTEFKYDGTNKRLSIGTDLQTISVSGATGLGIKLGTESEGATDLIDFFAHRHSATAGFGAHIMTGRSRGTHATPTIVQSGDVLNRYMALGYDGTDWEMAASIRMEVDGTPGLNDMPGRILFLTTPDGSATPAEAMRISQDKAVTMAGTLGVTGAITASNLSGTNTGDQDLSALSTVSSGAGAPSSTPTKVGDIYIDTTGDDAYIAVGSASSADWEKSNDGAGGGSGDVVGPASATDNAIARYDGTTGKLVQNSAVTVSDNGATAITIPDAANEVGLTINQNDATNDPLALVVNGPSAGSAAKVTTATLVQYNDEIGSNSDWSFNVAANGYPSINLQKTGGTLASPLATSIGPVSTIDSFVYNSTPVQRKSASIGVYLTDGTATSEDAYIYFQTMQAGSLYSRLVIGDGINGINVGNTGATGVVSSNGNQNLILQTGNATTGSITIVDGANGNINITPNGVGDVVLGGGQTTIQSGNLYNLSYVEFANISGNVIAGGYSNEILKLSDVSASSVNELTIANAITAVAPSISATGNDTNISLNLVPKGTGRVQANAVNIPTVSSTDTLTNKTLTDPKITTTENAQTGTTYTLVLTDASKGVTMNNAASNTLTIPPNSSVAFAVGTKIFIQQLGAGATTIAAGAGVTLNVSTTVPALIGVQNEARVIWKRATDTWQLI